MENSRVCALTFHYVQGRHRQAPEIGKGALNPSFWSKFQIRNRTVAFCQMAEALSSFRFQ